ncbi:hypothetical protein Taro_038421 [Colocasia esculenta]|uniref:Retrotransposon gag domain-containing protein n=1 Tax=Colocasia esculenta TaxID=4460 RepID=A0A843WFT7_COLES|nr:hypothetical protein [Colocasia esculenta]
MRPAFLPSKSLNGQTLPPSSSVQNSVFLCVFTDMCMISLARLRPVRGRRTRIKFVSGLTGLNEVFRHSCYQSKEVEMADRRDWGGGGEDPEESTQRMIEKIWESLTDIRMRMDQQAPVPPAAIPPVAKVPVAPVAPPPRVEVPYVAPVPPPVMAVEEPPPTYTGGPNPDTAEHWIHEIERVFTTMRCPATDKVVLDTYQLRGFAQQWWRLKMQTTFGQTFSCKGSVDTTINGVDTMAQSKGRNVKKRSTSVDTSPGQVVCEPSSSVVCESSYSLCVLSRRAQFGVVVLRLLFEPSCSVWSRRAPGQVDTTPSSVDTLSLRSTLTSSSVDTDPPARVI